MIAYKPIDTLFEGTIFAIGPDPLMLIIGFIILIIICIHFLKNEKGFNLKDYLIFLTVLILFSLQGGKVWHYFGMSKHHSDMSFFHYFINPGVGGLTSYGMFVGGIIGFILLMFIFRNNKISRNLIDVLPIGAAF